MNLDRESELKLFRNINGSKKLWSNDTTGKSFVDSPEELHLRHNQGKAKSNFIKYLLKDNGRVRILRGVRLNADNL